ncbi:MAG: DNA repair protein RadA [Spirochaetota bacterium]|nr:DNA repair protein RadA [Spirochaetota bacterium]
MAKKTKAFLCVSCGFELSKWFGRCPSCNEWNTIVEIDPKTPKNQVKAEVIPLSSIDYNDISRIKTGIDEFDLVCGGGIVPGSTILIGGEPGVGKSTLALQIAHFINTLYISGEESPVQLRYRAERLKLNIEKIKVTSTTVVEDISNLIMSEGTECVIIDSIQTLCSIEVPGPIGSVGQIKESTSRLVEITKKTNIPIILIGHITKEGSIAGPKVLEHLVDTVLYFEGDFSKDFRMLRAFKNRFGSVNEIGLFRMTDKGLTEVSDKNSIFLNSYTSNSQGNAISVALEGSRTILFEVQSLVAFTNYSNPRRMSDGFDFNRLILIVAVLEKHGFLKLSSFDVFVNVAGGYHINETSADLAVAMSIASSLKEEPIPPMTGFLGEISLSGEVRPVSQCLRRIQELQRSGFRRIVLSIKDSKDGINDYNGEIIGVRNISEVMEYLF